MQTEPPFSLTPEQSSRLWFQDPIHCPRALPPLSSSIWQWTFENGFLPMDTAVFNGFFYSSPRAAEGPPAAPISGDPRTNWDSIYLPNCRRQHERLSTFDASGMEAAQIVRFLLADLSSLAAVLADTIRSAVELGPSADRLHNLLEKEFGEEGGLLAATLLHGGDSDTASIGREVRELAKSAGNSPSVAKALRDGDFASAVSNTEEPWASALRGFLAGHGDEIALWGEIHEPAWGEDPLPLMRLVAATLKAPARSATGGFAAALADVRGRLGQDVLAEFEEALALSRDYVPIIEERARWQLKLMGSLRVPILTLGRRLVGESVLRAPADVFFLHLDELEAAARERRDLSTTVEERRAEWEYNLTLTAPLTLGVSVPWEVLGKMNSMMRRMFGAVALAEPTATVISGIAASGGVVTGRARVVRGLAEAEDIEDGDILVCPSTSPPWTPYLAVVSAVVTNAGGVLSHAAIEAREYGIPAVVGTRDGTERIPDRATITVDGTAGTVTIG